MYFSHLEPIAQISTLTLEVMSTDSVMWVNVNSGMENTCMSASLCKFSYQYVNRDIVNTGMLTPLCKSRHWENRCADISI